MAKPNTRIVAAHPHYFQQVLRTGETAPLGIDGLGRDAFYTYMGHRPELEEEMKQAVLVLPKLLQTRVGQLVLRELLAHWASGMDLPDARYLLYRYGDDLNDTAEPFLIRPMHDIEDFYITCRMFKRLTDSIEYYTVAQVASTKRTLDLVYRSPRPL